MSSNLTLNQNAAPNSFAFRQLFDQILQIPLRPWTELHKLNTETSWPMRGLHLAAHAKRQLIH